MKVFDLFSKKSEKDTAGNNRKNRNINDIRALEIYSGMRVIVESSEGRRLFIGQLQDLQQDTAKLYPYSETEAYQAASPVFAKLRGYNDRERKAVFMEGMITRRQKHIWEIENLTVTKVENERSYPRMSTDVDVTVTGLDGTDNSERICRLLNISVGGVNISSEYRYYKGNKFLMKAEPFEDSQSFHVYCEVLRVVQRDTSRFEYGCRFLELAEADQEQIARSITQMAETKD